MQRRKFLRTAGVGGGAAAVAGTLAAPAVAQSMPEVKWRLASSFPKSLDTIYGAGEFFAKRVAALTDNKFQIRVFAAGEIVPGLQVVDAVQNETVECGHTASYYYVGKDPTFAFDTAIPFGLNTRQHNAWVYFGGGLELMREFYKEYKMTSFLMSHTGAQMGGWWRKEIKSPEDMKGVKMRIGGFAGQVMAKLGVVPQQIAGGEIYPALEKGTIDAAEWVGPYDDEKLGFHKVAKYMHLPGVLELEANTGLYINKSKWAELAVAYQAMLRAACAYALMEMLAGYDARNPRALNRLVAAGAQLVVLSPDILKALRTALEQVLDEEAAKSEQFKRALENWRAFRAEQHRWFLIADARTEMSVYALTAAQQTNP